MYLEAQNHFESLKDFYLVSVLKDPSGGRLLRAGCTQTKFNIRIIVFERGIGFCTSRVQANMRFCKSRVQANMF